VVRAGVVAAVTPVGEVPDAAEELDARGGALIPGLHDHHVHLASLAAARASVRVGPPAVVDERSLEAALRKADRRLPPGRWLRCTGYHESVAGDIDRAALDRLVPPERPVRVQHRSGAQWVLGSRALALLGVDSADGRLYGADDRLRDLVGAEPPDLAGACAELVSLGVTGVTDLTPTTRRDDLELLTRADLPLRVHVTGGPGVEAPPGSRRVAVKLLLADHALPPLAELTAWIGHARAAGLPVAVHSVTLESLLLALAAWADAGARAGDRLEHGAVVPPEQARELARLGVTVVTQPNFVAERGDEYLADVDPRDLPHLYPCRSLLAAGVGVAFGTDAPFGEPDPWAAVRAAVERRAASGRPVGADEAVDAATALGCFLGAADAPAGPPRAVAPGAAADLCLLRTGLREALESPGRELVAATVVGGRVVYRG
jgi:predicted amidohydrolase YtcJ